MRALIGGIGPGWVSKTDAAIPPMRLGAVLVRVMAAALNRADLYMLQGAYNPRLKLGDVYPAGIEFAGIAETSSPLAPAMPAGARVMGVTMGAFVDYALCNPRMPLFDYVKKAAAHWDGSKPVMIIDPAMLTSA